MSFVDIGKIDLPDWQFDEEDWNNENKRLTSLF